MKNWDDFLLTLSQEMGEKVVNEWLKTLKIVHFDAGNLYLEAKDAFQVAWFEEHVRDKAKKHLLNSNHRAIKVHLTFANQTPVQKKQQKKDFKNTSWKPVLSIQSDPIFPQSSWDNYICENLSLEMFKEALQKLGTYNPLYIHGSSGCGKTHLLMGAVQILKDRGLNCLFVNAETFTEHVVAAIRNSAMQKFREMYRTHDVLIVDDIHLLGGRSATQEEFFHTFNTLHALGKQLIFASNTPPAALINIEPRLTSRFEWGLVLPIKILSSEGYKLLIQRYLNHTQSSLHNEVTNFLLTHFFLPKTVIQALETLTLRSHLDGINLVDLNAQQVKTYLFKLLEQEKRLALTPDKVMQVVSNLFLIKPEDIIGRSQTQECVLPRQIAMYICRTQLSMPFMKIAQYFSKDHSTVMTSVKIIQSRLEEKEVASYLYEIQNKLQSTS
jgi:chromosomal replication initiator protein